MVSDLHRDHCRAFGFSVFSTVHSWILLFHKRIRKRNIRNRGNSLLILCPSELTESCVHFLLPAMLAFLLYFWESLCGIYQTWSEESVVLLSTVRASRLTAANFVPSCVMWLTLGGLFSYLFLGLDWGGEAFVLFVYYFLDNIYHCACCRYSIMLNKRIVTEHDLGNLHKGLALFLSWLLALIKILLHLSVLDFS